MSAKLSFYVFKIDYAMFIQKDPFNDNVKLTKRYKLHSVIHTHFEINCFV